jgi:hypothetical protein
MEQLIELLKQIQELAGVAIEALQGASEGAQAGAEGGPPPEGGGGGGGGAPKGGPPPEGPPPGR